MLTSYFWIQRSKKHPKTIKKIKYEYENNNKMNQIQIQMKT
jgi:hypothetical protein